jgi:hypothetical protein
MTLADLPDAEKPYGRSITLYHDGTANVSGVDYGGKLTVTHLNAECVVLRCARHSRWLSVGSRKYEPPKDLVFAIETLVEASNGSRVLRVRPLVEINRGRPPE